VAAGFAILVLVGAVGLLALSTWTRHRRERVDRLALVDRSAFCVEVVNGSGRAGEAGKVATHLRAQGFRVRDVLNAERFDYPATVVIDRTGERDYATLVAREVGGAPVILQRADGVDCSVQILLGQDGVSSGIW
jgi:hypothetical protein